MFQVNALPRPIRVLLRILLSAAFCTLIAVFSFVVELYALTPLVYGSSGDPKAIGALVAELILMTPVSAMPAFVMAMYATRFIR